MHMSTSLPPLSTSHPSLDLVKQIPVYECYDHNFVIYIMQVVTLFDLFRDHYTDSSNTNFILTLTQKLLPAGDTNLFRYCKSTKCESAVSFCLIDIVDMSSLTSLSLYHSIGMICLSLASIIFPTLNRQYSSLYLNISFQSLNTPFCLFEVHLYWNSIFLFFYVDITTRFILRGIRVFCFHP